MSTWFMNILKLFDKHELDYTPIRRFEVSNKQPKHAHEMLKAINDAEDDAKQQELIRLYGLKPPLNMLLSLNFKSSVSLALPPGQPSTLSRDEATHEDLMTPLATQIGRLKTCVPNHPAKKMDKERVFIQILETIPPKDADVLVACKDKVLHEMFPNIKVDNLKAVFPNYVG